MGFVASTTIFEGPRNTTVHGKPLSSPGRRPSISYFYLQVIDSFESLMVKHYDIDSATAIILDEEDTMKEVFKRVEPLPLAVGFWAHQ
jgi:hypothetical protein